MAHGGQIAVPLDIAQAFVLHCSGQAPAFTEESLAEPPQQLPARSATNEDVLAENPPLGFGTSLSTTPSHVTETRQSFPAVLQKPAGTLDPPMHDNPIYEVGNSLAQQPLGPARLQSVPPLLVELSTFGNNAESPLPSLKHTGFGLRTPAFSQGVPALQKYRMCVHVLIAFIISGDQPPAKASH